MIEEPIRHWILIGDETALPAIARRIEELAPGVPVTSLVAIPGPQDEQRIETAAEHLALWVHRADPADATSLLARAERITLKEGTFVWIATEAGVARALKERFVARGQPAGWIKASGYWVAGAADNSAKDL